MTFSIPALGPGDSIHVVAPAGPVHGEAVKRGMAVLSGWGVSPVAGRHLLERQGYLAGSDEERAADLTAAFGDTGTCAVAFARGGYGTTRLLPLLDLPGLAARRRLIVGYSDATALGMALSLDRPQPHLYGPGIAELGAQAPDHHEASLEAGLLGRHPGGVQTIQGLQTVRPGHARAVVMGGCLSLMAALAGTPFMPSLRGRILFLEDVGEEPYRLDRMLTQLSAAGVVKGLSALILGRFTGCVPRPEADSPSAEEVLHSWARGLDVPAVAGLPAGHGPGRVTIPLGVEADLDAETGTVAFHHQ